MRLRGQSQGLQNVSSRTWGRSRGLHFCLLYFPQLTTFWLIFANQLWAVHFGTWLIAKLFHSVHKKLRTCGADFKYYEVADLRLRTSRITKLRTSGCGLQKLWSCELAVADSRISKYRCGLAVATKLLNVQLRTCGCELRKLKFGCGFANCGLEKKLAVPSTVLKHLPEPAQLLLLSLFNRSWHSHTFPSCWKPTTIIHIHKRGKPTSSPSFFAPFASPPASPNFLGAWFFLA